MDTVTPPAHARPPAASKSFSVADVASHYDELDGFYLRLWGEHVHHGLWASGDETEHEAVIRLLELVATRGDIRKGVSVCDVGCGYGATGRWLWDRYQAVVTGYTISSLQHAHAAHHPPPGHRYVLRDWLRNDEADASYDRVIAIESTEHMVDRQRVVHEVFRVLRPGGRFVVATWLSAPAARGWHRHQLLDPIRREGVLATALPTAGEWRSILRAAEFAEITADTIGPRVRRTWTVIARRVLLELTRRSGWAYLFDASKKHRHFAVTVFRMWLAYRVGAIDYGVFTGQKPA